MMSKQIHPPVKTEHPTIIKSESPEPEIVETTIDDIRDSSDEEIIEDKNDIEIVPHPLCEDFMKTETEPQIKHSGSVVTQVFENSPFIKSENTFKNENVCKTEDTSDGNVSKDTGQDSTGIKTRKSLRLENADVADCYRTCKTTSGEKDKATIEAPVSQVEPHEYTTLAEDKHVCNRCQHTCRQLCHLKKHIKTMHREVTKTYQCSYCSLKLKYKWGLQRHIKEKHTNTEDILKCHLCNMTSKVKRFLAEHMLVHVTHEEMKDKLKFCPICGKGFKRGSGVKNHVRYVHNKEKKKQLKCQECEYTTTNSDCLKLHVNKQHADLNPSLGGAKNTLKRFSCDQCSYATYIPSYLARHKLIHLEPIDMQYFRCYHCPYRARQKSNLKKHIIQLHFKNAGIRPPRVVHTQNREKRYNCDKCDYKTYALPNLKRHKLTHLKPEEVQYFYCYHCSYKCNLKDRLRRHITTHFKKEKMKKESIKVKKESIIKHVKKHPKNQSK